MYKNACYQRARHISTTLDTDLHNQTIFFIVFCQYIFYNVDYAVKKGHETWKKVLELR